MAQKRIQCTSMFEAIERQKARGEIKTTACAQCIHHTIHKQLICAQARHGFNRENHVGTPHLWIIIIRHFTVGTDPSTGTSLSLSMSLCVRTSMSETEINKPPLT